MPAVLGYPDNVYLRGCWENERYFADIADIIRKEFTLRNPLGKAACRWREKILAAECSVSMHFRHGDFVGFQQKDIFKILPLDYYHECVNRLKREYKNFTVFVFTDNPRYFKENLRLGVPMEFISGGGVIDIEELYLMSTCKHNVLANSTFSFWGAWLNPNPDKKVFIPIPSYIVGTKRTYRHFLAERNENSPLQSDRWIRVPVDFSNRPNVTMRPYFSLLLVVDDDIATIGETLARILAQDYKFYEVIIVDNCSTDGSGKLCRQASQARDNVTLIKLWNRISNGAAWNKALDLAQGDFVLFLKGNDRLLANALSQMYTANERDLDDIVCSTTWLKEKTDGNIDIAGKKFVIEQEAAFPNLQGTLRGKFDKTTLLRIFTADGGNAPIATKIFKRKFLAKKDIHFNDTDDAELLFAMDAMFQASKNIFVPNIFYVAPK